MQHPAAGGGGGGMLVPPQQQNQQLLPALPPLAGAGSLDGSLEDALLIGGSKMDDVFPW